MYVFINSTPIQHSIMGPATQASICTGGHNNQQQQVPVHTSAVTPASTVALHVRHPTVVPPIVAPQPATLWSQYPVTQPLTIPVHTLTTANPYPMHHHHHLLRNHHHHHPSITGSTLVQEPFNRYPPHITPTHTVTSLTRAMTVS